MAEEPFLADDLLRQLMSVGEVDLLVGVACHSSAEAMRQTLHAIQQSFQQNFIRQRVVIVSIDGGNRDDAKSSAADLDDLAGSSSRPGLSSLRTVHQVTAGFAAPPSPGMALRTILASADLLRAKAAALVSPGVSSLTPEWIANLLRPVYRENFDFVAPLYTRNKFQGLLARTLLYPMSRALFGRRIRELYSDEWGFSGRLGALCLNQDVWHEEAVRSRPEAWMALSAIAADFRCCQAFLGPKSQPQSGSTDIVEILRQTVGTLFWCLESQQASWMDREGSEAVPTIGPDHELSADPFDVNRTRIFEMFQTGVKDLEPLLHSILSRETLSEIQKIAAREPATFSFDASLWVRTLYDFASSYHHAVINRDHLVQALVPLYRGKIYSFLLHHAESTAEEMEIDNEQLCLEFERQKPYLKEKWNEKVEVKS